MDRLVPSATSRPDTVVELRDVWKVFRQTQRSGKVRDVVRNLIRPKMRRVEALRGVSLTVCRGEVVAYAGPNGAGKSTTVKLLSGLLAPDAGSVRALGVEPWRNRVDYVGRIGVVFGQRSELWWDHSVAVSYEWKRVVWQIPQPTFDRMRALVQERLGVGEFYETKARELSLGQRMRADLGMALLHEPELLLLDEPTLGLDVLAKRAILHCITDLNRQRNVTVLVTSHDMPDLEQLAGRIVMVHRGEIAFDGDFDRLRRSFADRRVLVIETESHQAPMLGGATLRKSQAGRHEYDFDANQSTIAGLLAEAAASATLLDVETHRAPIEDVIADLYEAWQRGHDSPAPVR